MPQTLYLNQYELSDWFGYSHLEWKDYLRMPETNRFIESEIASLTEIAARAALNKLSTGNASSNEVSAIKAILDKSKMLQQSNQSQETIMLTFIPPNSLQQGRINSTSTIQRKDSTLGIKNPSTEEKYQAIINGHSDHYPSLEEKHIFITKEMVEEKLREEAEQQRRMMENDNEGAK
jgi:hypothetical protein